MEEGLIGTAETVLRGQKAIWRLAEPMPDQLRQQLGELSVMISHLLFRRHYRTLEQIQGFFTQGIVCHDPFLLPDMAAAVERIEHAVQHGEQVAVYGDFDCDGLTAAAVLAVTLEGLGLHPIVHIPSRGEGHGLHPEGLAALADRGVTLIVTADCGITSIEEVRVARGIGMDVIITDHHEARADGSLPDCFTIAPTRHDSRYPCRFLCGVGVAHKLAQALADRFPSSPRPELLLDLVALGTVADVVPLRDENRSLVIQGLGWLQQTQRPGLLALFEVAGVDRGKIDPSAVSYYLAPRINAANRMASPQLAYDLITATDGAIAARLAGRLHSYNQQRQLLVAESFQTIATKIGEPPAIAEQIASGSHAPVLLVIGPWPPGVSGLLASKLVDRYGLPAFVGSDAGDGIVAVSARGVPGAHIDELLEACEAACPGGLFLGYGGHTRAGGFRVDAERVDLAREILEIQARIHVPTDGLGSSLDVDATVHLGMLTLDAAHQIEALAPFGTEFDEPLFLVRKVTLRRLAPTRDGKHVRLTLQQGHNRLDGMYFNAPQQLVAAPVDSLVDLVFHLQVNKWNGLTKPEMRVRDWRPAA